MSAPALPGDRAQGTGEKSNRPVPRGYLGADHAGIGDFAPRPGQGTAVTGLFPVSCFLSPDALTASRCDRWTAA
jgi:hypothetical protein